MSIEKYKDKLQIKIQCDLKNKLHYYDNEEVAEEHGCENYKTIQKLGYGSWGKIWKVIDKKTDIPYILKEISYKGIKSTMDTEAIFYNILGNTCPNLMSLQKIWFYDPIDSLRPNTDGILYYLFDDTNDSEVFYQESMSKDKNHLIIN